MSLFGSQIDKNVISTVSYCYLKAKSNQFVPGNLQGPHVNTSGPCLDLEALTFSISIFTSIS